VSADLARFSGTVFLDRDGTINRKAAEDDYVKTLEEFEFLPAAPEAIRALNETGLRVIVVTNQRGIALGRMSEDDLNRLHAHMVRQLADEGATIDAIYHCPHDRDSCTCRKPGVGMFLRAAAEHPGVRFDTSAIIGDSPADMEAGTTLGMTRVLIERPGTDQNRHSDAVDHRAQTLREGVDWLLRRSATDSLTGAR
jgi:D-glycero-D-manno-heptose 1,7-bisphosphate phosphatase